MGETALAIRKFGGNIHRRSIYLDSKYYNYFNIIDNSIIKFLVDNLVAGRI